MLVELSSRAQVQIIGPEVLRRLAIGPVNLSELQARFDNASDAARYPVLQLEDVVEDAVETISPDMGFVCRVDQLRVDANIVPGLADRAFEYVANSEFVA